MADQKTQLTIGGYAFVCVPLSQADFTDTSAVYVIICVDSDGKWRVIDVGQTGELGSRIDAHDRKGCWQKNCPNGNIWVCVYPMTGQTKEARLKLEAELRLKYSPVPCGTR